MIKLDPSGAAKPIRPALLAYASQAPAPDFAKTLDDGLHAPSDLEAAFQEASGTYGIPSQILKAVAKAESGFDPQARSHCGAMGIMQLMPATARSLGVTDPWDGRQNILGGSKYLCDMLHKYDGNLKLALAAYNAGSGNVDKYGGVPPFDETRNYVNTIFGYLKQPQEMLLPPNEGKSYLSSPSSGLPYKKPLSLTDKLPGFLAGINGSPGNSGSDFPDQIKNFDDFTVDDYLMLLEMMRLKMNSSLTKSPDYER